MEANNYAKFKWGSDVTVVLKIKPPMFFSKENADELILRLEQMLQEDFIGSF